jgi:hypothetical protein
MKVCAPSLAVILFADNKRKVEMYAAELFNKGPAALQPNGPQGISMDQTSQIKSKILHEYFLDVPPASIPKTPTHSPLKHPLSNFTMNPLHLLN